MQLSDLPARLCAALPVTEGLALAVSGGGDSMAMLHLAVAAGLRPAVVTVNHGLRPEAAAEAVMVAETSRALGLSHDTLLWHGWGGRGNLQDAARKARRSLITEWAKGRGITAVALAHTEDDVAETFLMRLARGAGVDGLSAMSALWQEQGLLWLRPLLDVSRADLRLWLLARNLTWVDDPSNAMSRYDRVRMRQAQPVLDGLGLRTVRLAEVARHMAEARAALDALADDWAARTLSETAGTLRIDPALWQAPAETQRRLIARVILWIAPAAYPPRGADLTRLISRLASGQSATLGGCRFLPGPLAVREARAAASRQPTALPWDGRWRFDGDLPPDAETGPLGAAGLAQCPDWRATGLPRAALLAAPALWQGDRLLAAPFAGLSRPGVGLLPLRPSIVPQRQALSH